MVKMFSIQRMSPWIQPILRAPAKENLIWFFQANPKVWIQFFTTNDATLND